MTDPKPFSILLSPAWPSLARRLDGAVTADPSLASAREALLRPIRLLEMIAAAAPAALGDDFLAAERVRAVLRLAEPWKDLAEDASLGSAGSKAHHAAPYEPGILDHGALVIVALAAIRVTADRAEVAARIRTVVGLALAASPAEVIGRLDPRQPDAAEMRTILGSLAALGAIGEPRPAVLRTFAADPVERGRRRCLIRSLAAEAFTADMEGPWDGAFSDPIERVVPLSSWPGDVQLVGRFSAKLRRQLEEHELTVVCASPDRPPIAASVVKALPRTIKVNVPAAAPPGWLGFSGAKRKDESNRFREQVRDRWRRRSGPAAPALYHEYLRHGPVPVDEIPLLGTEWSSPPRAAGNRFAGRSPSSLDTPGLDGAPSAAAVSGLEGVVLVRPMVLRGGASVSVRPEKAIAAVLEVARRMNVTLDAGAVRELPWVEDPLAVLSSDVRTAEDPRLPLLLDELSRVAARTAGFEGALWLLLVPDESDVKAGAATKLDPWPGFESHLSAEAALAVAVASPRGLQALFGQLHPASGTPPAARPAAARLRLVGTFDHDGQVALDPPREEIRAAGPGAPFDTGVVAVALDAGGRALASVPVKTLRRIQPAAFVLLLPVSPEVAAVELRIEDQVLRRIPKNPGPPSLTITSSTAAGEIAWTYGHPTSARPDFEIEVVDGPLATPALSPAPSARLLQLPLQRFPREQTLQFQVVVSDGWNAVARPVDRRFHGSGPLVARRVKIGEWWADTDVGGALVWALDDVEIGRGRVLALPSLVGRDLAVPPPNTRKLTLAELAEKGPALLTDTRVLQDPDA